MPLEEGQLDSQCLRSGPLLRTILHFLLGIVMVRLHQPVAIWRYVCACNESQDLLHQIFL